MAKQSPQPPIPYVDRPEVSETFADSIHLIGFDAQGMRIEFCVTRMEKPKPGSPPTGKRYTICRLVLPPNTGIELADKLKNLVSLMEKEGVIKKPPQTPALPQIIQ